MKNIKLCGGLFDLDNKIKEKNLLEKEYNSPEFWNNQERTQIVIDKLNELNSFINPMLELNEKIDVLKMYLELDSDSKDEMSNDCYNILKETKKLIKEQELAVFLNGEYDNYNTIFEIHAGAGGTESCDWASMLSRMYEKYFANKKYKYEVLDVQEGEEAGIKSIVYIVSGKHAYGYLKSEKGVHRLVRVSPFDSNHRRHTSFAAVDVIPEFENVELNINESDIRVDVYRSSGCGGQGVNTTDSAVRLTHIPTGIVVTCQNERSQIKNKATALKVLKSKLYQLQLREQQEKIEGLKNNNNIEFGSQIRSYVLHPYSMIKDHRTEYETSNVNKILDGNIDEFIDSYLRRVNND